MKFTFEPHGAAVGGVVGAIATRTLLGVLAGGLVGGFVAIPILVFGKSVLGDNIDAFKRMILGPSVPVTVRPKQLGG